ncbi:MAG: M14 family metallopeptidase [Balneolaceae bacterium]|nr:M14 family metallopeptidase [Balneolaceae bacterium]
MSSHFKPSQLWGVLFLFALLSTSCSSSEKFSGFSYDPEGATVTTDKEITPQHERTIGISSEGVWLSNEFPGARMNDFYRLNDSLYQVVLEPENHPINNSPWYAFKVWSDTAKTVSLKLQYRHGNHRYFPEISHDGTQWMPIDSAYFSQDTTLGTATLELDLSEKPLWVSAQELLTVDDYTAWADSLSGKAFVSQDTAGYSHQSRAVKRIVINELEDPNQPHGVLLLTGRLHPPEVTGALASLYFIDELASDTEIARTFRRKFEVVAYPLANPDGVQNGHWRHNAAGVDLNRDWIAFNQPETQAIRDDILQHVGSDSLKKVYYGIDFHSTNENIFYPINREISTFPEDFTYVWVDSLQQVFPDTEFSVEPFDTSSPIAKNWIYRTFGADAVTYEVNDAEDRKKIEEIARTSARLVMQNLLRERNSLK